MNIAQQGQGWIHLLLPGKEITVLSKKWNVIIYMFHKYILGSITLTGEASRRHINAKVDTGSSWYESR